MRLGKIEKRGFYSVKDTKKILPVINYFGVQNFHRWYKLLLGLVLVCSDNFLSYRLKLYILSLI